MFQGLNSPLSNPPIPFSFPIPHSAIDSLCTNKANARNSVRQSVIICTGPSISPTKRGTGAAPPGVRNRGDSQGRPAFCKARSALGKRLVPAHLTPGRRARGQRQNGPECSSRARD